MSKEFLTIAPRDHLYVNYNTDALRLRVIRDKGVEVTPDIDLKVNKFSGGGNQIINNSNPNYKFKIDVLIKPTDKVNAWQYQKVTGDVKNAINMTVTDLEFLDTSTEDHILNEKEIRVTKVLDYWMQNCIVLNVVTDAIDIQDDTYIITGNNTRKQVYDDSTVWTIEFTKFQGFNNLVFKGNTEQIDKALGKNTKTAEQKAKEVKSLRDKFKKCDYHKIKYSKTKKTSECVKYMQKLLIHYKVLDDVPANRNGWFNTTVQKALKKFQKRYKAKYNLNVDGKVDYKTHKALWKGGSTQPDIIIKQ